MARGGRGYAAVPAGDEHMPRRAEERGADMGDQDVAEQEEHDRAQLTSGVTSSDHVDSDSEHEETATQQRASSAPPPSTAVVTAERPQEERVDRKEERDGAGDNSNNNDNQHTEDASSAATPAAASSSSSSQAESSAAAAEEEPLPPGAIRIRILDLNGKFFSIACELDWPVARLKDKVHEAADVAVAAQRLIYRGRVLEDEKQLDDYKLEDGHTIHLFVRMNATPEPEPAASDGGSATSGSGTAGTNGPTLARFGDDGVTIVHITSETISSAVFPSDSARRVDPLMLDSPLGNCARRVKLWSSFLLIIYTMKVMGQFALLANDQQMRQEQNGNKDDSNGQDRYYDRYDYPPYYNQDPMVSALELMIHAFGVYVGCVGFKAAHDTDIRPIRFYCRGVVWLAFLTVIEQMYVTYQISQSDYPETRIQYPYGPAAPSKDDIISANVFQTVMLVVMWIIAIAHSYAHQAEVARYNESFAAAAMNAVPPAHLPESVV